MIRRGTMIFAERDEDVRVAGPDQPRSRAHKINLTERKADVVENAVNLRARDFAANRILHQIAQTRGFLNARSGLRTQMENELSTVGAGEEVLAEPRHQKKRRSAREQYQACKDDSA